MTMITTERLILRPLDERGLDDLVVAINNFQIVKNTARIPFPYSRKDAEDYLALTRKSGPSDLFLSVALKEAPQRVVGGISAEGGAEDSELGYWIAEPLWGKGYMREAARGMTAHVFQYTEYHTLVAGYRIGNEASRRILSGLGFTPTGEEMITSRGLGYLVPVMRMALTARRLGKAAWAMKERQNCPRSRQAGATTLDANADLKTPAPRISSPASSFQGRRCVWRRRACRLPPDDLMASDRCLRPTSTPVRGSRSPLHEPR